MSLALVQDYVSDEEKKIILSSDSSSSSSDEDEGEDGVDFGNSKVEVSQNLKSTYNSLLPSPSDVFSEITGPPDYLKASATDPMPSWQSDPKHLADYAIWSYQNLHKSQAPESFERRALPLGAIIEAKAQLVEVNDLSKSDPLDVAKQTGARVPGVELPPPEDAAQLLRMCLQCGVPKTYSGAKERMVCPLCNDHVRTSVHDPACKRGSNIKDKERSKRLKGQSSHATWKSETEMQLRQQFD